MKDQDGYIKFKYEWDKKPFTFPREQFERVNYWRQKLFDMKLIGVYDDGIGYGNISIRIDETNNFIITGSATGRCKNLNRMHYSMVNYYDIDDNFVKCMGEIKASSESLTHAAVYQEAPSVNAIVHVHNKAMWDFYKNVKPTTSEEAPFGTPEIANEIRELVKKDEVLKDRLIVMGGHEDGLIAFGKDVEEAGQAMMEYYNQATVQNKK